MKVTMRILINLEERVTVRLTHAGLKVLQEWDTSARVPVQTLSLREIFRIFGSSFQNKSNPQLFENNDFELNMTY